MLLKVNSLAIVDDKKLVDSTFIKSILNMYLSGSLDSLPIDLRMPSSIRFIMFEVFSFIKERLLALLSGLLFCSVSYPFVLNTTN